MATKQIKVGGFGVFEFDDADYPEAIDTTGAPGGDAPIKVANTVLSDLTSNVRLVESDANKELAEVNDLTNYIAAGTGIVVAGSSGTVTISLLDRAGELYQDGTLSSYTPVGGSWVKLNNFTTGLMKNCSAYNYAGLDYGSSPAGIKVSYAGIYLLLASFTIYPSSIPSNQGFEIVFSKGSTILTQTRQRIEFSNNDDLSFTISGVVSLAANDIVYTRFKRVVGASANMVVRHANFKVTAIQ